MKQLLEEVTLLHFSHHHPLVRTKLPPAGNITCSGCKLNILFGREYYCCKTCPFVLHQVCYNMPRKTQHPGHPNNYLALLVMPPSAKDTFKCKACGDNISGFYYNCAESGICYHTLCTALPLSVAITPHPHTLKLVFSPPYEFECDLCKKPSYNGWLYRCRFCEFDTHLACAIYHQRTQSFKRISVPLPDPLTRQVIYSSPSLMETNRKIEYGSEGSELMQLVAQGVARSNKESIRQEMVHSAVAGWDERLNSPKEKPSIRNGQFGGTGQTRPDITGTSPNPGQVQDIDQPSLISGDLSTTPSYQFSDVCFSIDLSKSYPSYDHKSQGSKEDSHHDSKVFPEVKQTISYHNNVLFDRNVDSSKQAKQELHDAKMLGFDVHYMGLENRLSERFLIDGGTLSGKELDQKNKRKNANESRGKSSISDQSTKSDTASSSCSCWWKLLQCCYYPRYEKGIEIIKDGRM